MFTVTLINALVVMLVVVIHYECLLRLNDWLPRLKLWSRFRIVIGVFGALVAHALEVWCFALAYYLMANAKGCYRPIAVSGCRPLVRSLLPRGQ